MRSPQIVLITLVGLLLATVSLSAQTGLKKKADKQYQIHDYKEAINSYLRFISRNKESVSARGRLADSYRHLNNLTEAAKWYEQIINLPNIDPEYFFQYGQTLKGLSRYEDARKVFLKYAETNSMMGMHYASSCEYAMQKAGSPAAFKVNAEFTNTPAADFAPAFFKDQVVFASSRTDFNRNNKARDEVNLPFVARRDQNNYLMQPALLHPRLNSGNEGPLSYDGDGRWMAVTRNNFVNGVRQLPSSGVNLNIQIAEVLPNGEWQNEKYFPYNGSNFSTAYPALSKDGNTLYFASNRPDGFGGFDLFVTYRVGNTWTTPENLGPTVNTQGNEIAPFFDGQDLYFSSDWHKGMGGFDVFRAAKTGGSWDRVYHLDTNVNSPKDDYGFIYDKLKNIGYLVSNRDGGKGNEDIYRLSKASDNLEIIVLDANTMQPIVGADIDFSSCGQPTFVTDISGRHILQIPQGLNCQALIRKQGYQASTLNVAQSQLGGAQSLQVLLRRSGTNTDPNMPVAGGFTGQVYDAATSRGLSSVFISAVNQQTGRKLETMSDAAGNYSLSLQPYSNYQISYTRMGFVEVSRSINTGTGQEKNILGSYPLRSSGVVSPVDPGPGTNPNPVFESGFSVQVAAFASSRTSDLSRFKSLGSIGNVYNRYEGNKTKVRVGVFSTRAEANAAKNQIRGKGFKDCFVVAETMEGLGQEVVLANVNDASKGDDQPTSGTTSGYKVRLAAYKNTKFFQRNKVSGFGLVESRIKGPWTIMLLSGYSSLGEARLAAENARRAGFPEAHVVMDNGVTMTKVN